MEKIMANIRAEYDTAKKKVKCYIDDKEVKSVKWARFDIGNEYMDPGVVIQTMVESEDMIEDTILRTKADDENVKVLTEENELQAELTELVDKSTKRYSG